MDHDVIIVGSGQAGVPLATRLAGRGKRVLLAERGELGGTCTNTGCTPTKTIVASARAAHVARTAARLGVRAGPVEVDFPAVIARKDEIVAKWRESAARRLAGAGERLVLVRGQARLAGDGVVEIGGERHRAPVIVLDVGGRPVQPPIDGLADVPWLDNRRVMELRALPRRLLVVGGGYIGCEFAQAYRRFGADVAVVEPGPRLLGREDPEISEVVATVFRSEGIELHLGARVTAVAGREGAIRLTLSPGATLDGTHLLVATGRRPNTDDLGCDAAGVALDPHGFITVDDQYRTSAPGVYAVGDCTGGPQFTHASWDDHRLLLDVLEGRRGRGRGDRIIPYTVFVDPQVGAVGPTEAEARERGIPVEVARLPFDGIARAIETDEKAGLLKVLIDPGTERIVGARIVGAEAGELVHVFVALMQAGASARAVVEMEAIHPAFAEGLQSVLMTLPRFALN